MITEQDIEEARDEIAFHQRNLDECLRDSVPHQRSLELLREAEELLHVRQIDMAMGF